MKTQQFPASQRGTKDIGWLKSKFVFSFGDYYNPMARAFLAPSLHLTVM